MCWQQLYTANTASQVQTPCGLHIDESLASMQLLAIAKGRPRVGQHMGAAMRRGENASVNPLLQNEWPCQAQGAAADGIGHLGSCLVFTPA